LSGPLLDRIDLQVEVPALDFDELSRRQNGEPSAVIKARVNAARKVQMDRVGPDGADCNAHMDQREMHQYCDLDDAGQTILRAAYDRMGLTARSYDRILRVARTIADLDGSEAIQSVHLAEAIAYRTTDYLKHG
jgi:magnesium chelatase family protein